MVPVLVLDLRLGAHPNSNVGEGLDTGGSFPPDNPKNAAEKGLGRFSSKIGRRPHHEILQEMHTICSYENSDRFGPPRTTTWGEVKNGAMLLLAVICALYLSFKVF